MKRTELRHIIMDVARLQELYYEKHLYDHLKGHIINVQYQRFLEVDGVYFILEYIIDKISEYLRESYDDGDNDFIDEVFKYMSYYVPVRVYNISSSELGDITGRKAKHKLLITMKDGLYENNYELRRMY